MRAALWDEERGPVILPDESASRGTDGFAEVDAAIGLFFDPAFSGMEILRCAEFK